MNAIITGAASGIGCRLVTLLAQGGHFVLAADVDADGLARAATECAWPEARVATIRHDVASPESWSRVMAVAAERFASLDWLVNVAGVLRVEPVAELRPESVAMQLDVNTKGVILGTQAAAAVMVRQGRGRIVNVASMAALAPVPGISVYSASKFAVRGFSLAAAQELEPQGVSVSVICPDAVATPMVDYQLDHAGAALTFSGSRILTAEEVARAIQRLLEGRIRREVMLPWRRGALARISTLLPRWLQRRITAGLTKRGLGVQERMRQRRP